MSSIENNKKNNEPQKITVIELLLIFLVLSVLGYLVFSLISQIYLLNLELKNLVTLVQSLQENQIDLKNQLSTKDQQIKLLENTINNLNISSKSTQNFELLKKEVIKNNSEMSQFYIKTSIVMFGAILVFKIVKNFL